MEQLILKMSQVQTEAELWHGFERKTDQSGQKYWKWISKAADARRMTLDLQDFFQGQLK